MPINKKNLNCWEIIDNRVVLNSDFLKAGLDKNNKWGRFAKITGTSFSSIFGLSEYNSPFKTWMKICKLFKDVADPTVTELGNRIEPLLREYAIKKMGIKYISYDPKQIDFDIFKEDEIYGGIPDGEPVDNNGNVDYSNNQPMLEIKTSSIDKFKWKMQDGNLTLCKDSNGLPMVSKKGEKKEHWFKNGIIDIPIEYQFQLSLYLCLRNTDKGVFVVSFLKTEDYLPATPYSCDDHEIHFVEFKIKDKELFKKYLEKGREWYNTYVRTGKSPEMTESDIKWLNEQVKFAND